MIIMATAISTVIITDITMAKKTSTKRATITIAEQLREAILASDHPRSEIARQTGVDEARLSRFVTEDEDARRDLRLESAAAIATFLGLELAPKKRAR